MDLLFNLLKIFYLISVCSAHFNYQNQPPNKDSCFCQLSGEIDDCCCKIEDVEKLNNFHMFPRLSNLVNRDYFRYFKLKLYTKCQFWVDFKQCRLKDCSVDACSEDELPSGLKGAKRDHEKMKYSAEANKPPEGPCAIGHEEELGEIDETISEVQKESFEYWSDYDSDTSFCVDLEEDSDTAQWVDLLLNPEQYTGYQGEGAHRIWGSIYKENCFLPNTKMSSYDEFKNNFLSKTCLEKRVFYRTVSGLHASINIHLSYKYLIHDHAFTNKKIWGPNLEEFQKRFDPETTNGNGPHWLKNLFFTYLITLRAVTKAALFWKETVFYTGNEKEDNEVKQIILELVKTSKSCPSTFDESQMFTGDPEKAQLLKEEFRLHYMNITRIMDCVGCEKCRLWGKLQTTGIGTALKILFSSDKWDEIPIVKGKQFHLSRTEIVALFNALNKLSTSIHILSEFKKLTGEK